MNHPLKLTDEILQQIAEDPLDGVVGSTFVKEYMRSAADWQLEQVIDWIKENLTAGDVTVMLLKEAMRPQEEQ